MPADLKPATWIASWSENGTTVSFPLASVPNLTAADADGVTGDIRKVLYDLCEKLYANYNALAAADKPTKMVIRKATAGLDSSGTLSRSFTLTFTTAPSAEDVVAE